MYGQIQYSTDGGLSYINLGSATAFPTSSGSSSTITNTGLSLSVTSGNNIRFRLYIYANPSASSSRSVVISNVQLVGNTTVVSAGTMSYTWSLGDATTSTSTNITSKTYSTAGTYYVKLITTSSTGCKDSITKTVTTTSSPVAAFTVNTNPQCLSGNSFTFTNTSTGTQSGSSGTAQAYIASWALTSNSSVSISGAGSSTVYGQTMGYGSGLTLNSYNSTNGVNLSASSWYTSLAAATNSYADFIISPNAGYNLTTTAISIDTKVTGGGTSDVLVAQFQYSTDAVTYTSIGTTQSFATSSGSNVTFSLSGLSISVPDASVLRIRMFIYSSSSASISRSVYLKNMSITGTSTIVPLLHLLTVGVMEMVILPLLPMAQMFIQVQIHIV